MLERSSRSFAMILENQDVAEALVVFQVEHAVAIGPKNVFHCFLRQLRQGGLVLRRFDDDFVRADAVHLVEQAFAFAVQFPFNAQSGKSIRHDADIPSRCVRAGAIAAVGENLRRRLRFIARAEGAIEGRPGKYAFAQKIHGALAPFRGDDYPPPCNWIFT